jgi:outer membrane murein-binding lipoprotein Lpp
VRRSIVLVLLLLTALFASLAVTMPAASEAAMAQILQKMGELSGQISDLQAKVAGLEKEFSQFQQRFMSFGEHSDINARIDQTEQERGLRIVADRPIKIWVQGQKYQHHAVDQTRYQNLQLPVGKYKVKVQCGDFEPNELSDVIVRPREVTTLEIKCGLK